MKPKDVNERLDRIAANVEKHPMQARLELVRLIGELADAQMGLSYGILVHQGKTYTVEMDGFGPKVLVDYFHSFTFNCMEDLSAPLDGDTGDCVLDNPYFDTGGFSIGEAEWARSVRFYSFFLEPMRIRSIIGSYFFLDGQCVGWGGVYRSLDQPSFSRRDLDHVKAHEARLTELFTAALTFGPWRIPAGGAVGVLDREGRVVQASADAPAWFREDHVCADLRAAARDFAKGTEASRETFVRRHAVTLTRLVGKDGESIHARVVPTAAQSIPALARLSERQRAVALALVEGATIAEAASTLAMSPETVRSHLKAIYAQFGVSTRVELMKALRS